MKGGSLATEVTLDGIRQVVREVVREEVQPLFAGLDVKIENLRKMLEEDARAESRRLDRVNRRSLRTQRLLARHIAEHARSK
jgi:hypothetical protein